MLKPKLMVESVHTTVELHEESFAPALNAESGINPASIASDGIFHVGRAGKCNV
jgi:hypothetical protein